MRVYRKAGSGPIGRTVWHLAIWRHALVDVRVFAVSTQSMHAAATSVSTRDPPAGHGARASCADSCRGPLSARRMRTHVHVTCTCTWTYMDMYMAIYMHMYMHMYMCMHIYMHMYMYVVAHDMRTHRNALKHSMPREQLSRGLA